MSNIHIFDVDHTLVRGSTGRHYIGTAIKTGLFPWRVLLSLPSVYLRYRLGTLKQAHIDRELPLLAGIERSTLESIAEQSFETKIRSAMYEDAERYVRELHANGDSIILATSSVDIIVNPLARYLKVDDIIASEMEFRDGRCTGRFLETPTFSEEKKTRVARFLEDRDWTLSQCAFYSDSIYDLPLLEAVAQPVAVNPDFMLARHARKEGWRILKFS